MSDDKTNNDADPKITVRDFLLCLDTHPDLDIKGKVAADLLDQLGNVEIYMQTSDRPADRDWIVETADLVVPKDEGELLSIRLWPGRNRLLPYRPLKTTRTLVMDQSLVITPGTGKAMILEAKKRKEDG